MPKLIKRDRGNYTNVSNIVVRDSRLSWKARGIFLYLWSQANEWQFYVSEVATHATDGEDALRSGLKELEQYGYLERTPAKNEKGAFNGLLWILQDKPEIDDQHSGFPDDGEIRQKAPKKTDLAETGKTGGRKTRAPENPTLRNNNNKNYQYKELTIERKEDKGTAQDAEPPIPYKEIIDYLNQKTGAHYKPSSKANQKLIKARIKEGYTVQDFKTVVDNKAFEWQHTDMWQFMRPSTLFSPSHFDDYLNANNLDKHKNKPTGGGYDSTQIDLSGVNDDDLPF